MKHTKCSLDILPSGLLLFRKPLALLISRIADCLHKGGLGGIDIVSKIVTHIIWIAIDLIRNLWGIVFCQPSKH